MAVRKSKKKKVLKKNKEPKLGLFKRLNKKNKKKKSIKESIKRTTKDLRKKPLKASKELLNSTKEEHIKTGVPGFDNLFTNGIPKGASILIEGGPGSGKTIFCLQSGYNACKRGEKVLYMSFEEPERRLVDHMRRFGWDIDKYLRNGTFVVQRFNALDIARSVEALLSEAKRELLIDVKPMLFPKNFEPDLVLIDSLTSVASAFSGEQSRFRIYMEQLFRYLEREDITSFLIRETANPTHVGRNVAESAAVSFLSDGIISIYNAFYETGDRDRAIEVVKMRGEHFKSGVSIMNIGGKGITVYPNKKLKKNYRLA